MTHARVAWLALAATLALATFVYVARLGTPSWGEGPPRYVFDEKYTAFTANRVVKGDPAAYRWAARRYELAATDTRDLSFTSRAEWTSPPGAPLAVAPFIAAFGFSELSTRISAVMAALVALIATGYLAGLRRAWCACALLAFDGVFFVLARTVMPYMFLTAAITSGAALLVVALRSPRRRLLAAVAAGVAFGVATSVRLTAIPLTVALIGALVISKDGVRERFWRVGLVAGVVAIVTYLATFLPHILHGGQTLADVARFHQKLAWFHGHVQRDFPQTAPWYAWPWALRPVVFRAEPTSTGQVAAVWCTGGKLLWWAVIPVVGYALWRLRERDWRDLVPMAGILATWLPWAPLNRFGFFYYLLPALPFAAVLVSRALEESKRRWVAPVYVAVSLALFAATYPVLAAMPISEASLRKYGGILGVPIAGRSPAPPTPRHTEGPAPVNETP